MNRRGFLKAIGMAVPVACAVKALSGAVKPERHYHFGDPVKAIKGRWYTRVWADDVGPWGKAVPEISNPGVIPIIKITEPGTPLPVDPDEITCRGQDGTMRFVVRYGPGRYGVYGAETGDMFTSKTGDMLTCGTIEMPPYDR